MHKVHKSGINICVVIYFYQFSCPDYNSCFTDTIDMKQDIWIELDERKRHAQRPIDLVLIFWELFPFVILSCPDDYSCSANAIVMKLYLWPEYDKVKYYA